MEGGVECVRGVLAAMAARDWETVERHVADDVMRVGPYGDTYRGRAAYLKFLRAVFADLAGYEMHVDRVLAAGPGVVVAELRETVEVAGRPLETPEALLFDLDGGGRISRIAVYIQNPPGERNVA